MNSFMFEMPFETFVTVRSPSGCSMKFINYRGKEITLEPEFLSESPRPDDYRFAHLLYTGDRNMFLEITLYSLRKTHLVKFTWTF